MTYLFKVCLELVTSMITGLVQYFGDGVMSLMTIDVGKDSLLGIALSGIIDFTGIFQVMAFGIIALNFLWQLIRIMVSPEGGQETPISLVVSSAVALFFVSCSGMIISIAMDFFNEFYNTMLSINADGARVKLDLGFQSMITSLSNLPTYPGMTSEGQAGMAVVSGAASLGKGFLILILGGMLAYEFIMYLVEVVERYVLLGILYYTSPLAFAMAGSKSTRPVFASWVRMVASQLFLMVCNVFFYRLFLIGLNNFPTAIEKIQVAYAGSFNGAALAICIVYMLLLYGVLRIGTKVDSYLGTLGLSAAQTGRGMGAALVATGLGLRRTWNATVGLGKATVKAAKAAPEVADKVGTAMRTRRAARDGYGIESANFNRDGSPTNKTIQHALSNQLSKEGLAQVNAKPRKTADAFLRETSGLPQTITNNSDRNTFSFDKSGSAHITTHVPGVDGKAGADVDVEFGTEAAMYNKYRNLNNEKTMSFTRTGEDGKAEKMVAIVRPKANESGAANKDSQAAAMRLMTENPEMDKRMQEFAQKPNHQVTNDAPGVWTVKQVDDNGNITRATQYQSDNVYHDDAAMNSHPEEIGNQKYHVFDNTAAAQGHAKAGEIIPDVHADGLTVDTEKGREFEGTYANFTLDTVKRNFPSLAHKQISNIDTTTANNLWGANSGAFTYQLDGQTHLCAPSAQFELTPAAVNSGSAHTTTSANNAPHVDVVVPNGADLSTVLTQRETNTTGTFIPPREKNYTQIPAQPAPQTRTRSGVVEGAKEKKHAAK